jgi:hypothetical protein
LDKVHCEKMAKNLESNTAKRNTQGLLPTRVVWIRSGDYEDEYIRVANDLSHGGFWPTLEEDTVFPSPWKRWPRIVQRIVVTADLMLAAVATIINGDIQSWGFPDQASMPSAMLFNSSHSIHIVRIVNVKFI